MTSRPNSPSNDSKWLVVIVWNNRFVTKRWYYYQAAWSRFNQAMWTAGVRYVSLFSPVEKNGVRQQLNKWTAKEKVHGH